ncbi:(d)CMP kinase [Candidatus Pseudoscillospira sp. SGI.172]|uniref:(d)CMP kinase n=1 Tax=Candidatus Pseudoscillospira sp. SGI.172 TaxID=3420582 RepID=UPI0009B93D9A
MKYRSIAVDGPSGAGKSTMARMVARALGFLYVDTGAIYRTLALFALREGAAPADAQAVAGLLPRAGIRMGYGEDGGQRMYLNGEDVTEAIRTPEVSAAASQVSAHPQVRAFLLDMQRDLAKTGNVIMDGRDIGTVVLPDADVKIFLTASAEDRARRRLAELLERGEQIRFDTVLSDITERDRRDSTRSAAPLRQAEDALLVDTTDKSLEESFALLLQTIQEKLA